jgi:squalene-hopene/tetraprenyl-beta-curcumene cyclase
MSAANEAVQSLVQSLLRERNQQGYWTGELSASALSTATAVMALIRAVPAAETEHQRSRYQQLVESGLQWLAGRQNSDGGWGDTVLSISNISTTMLAHGTFAAARQHSTQSPDFALRLPVNTAAVIAAAERFIDSAGGVTAVLKRYGKDHTFSVPILTHCALAGTVDWKHVIPLPFELSCIPAGFYAAVKMPVVSYALPALIAIGQVIFHHQSHRNPVIRFIRRAAVRPSLRVLSSIQPQNGGFLEATPLTSFVCMSLLGCGLAEHAVTRKCLQFLTESVREDGSWPIDTNLATWVTTLSVNALSGAAASGQYLPESQRQPIRRWLLQQQYRVRHPYTNAAPGGWSWTDLPGGVPDADDTPGAILALLNLRGASEDLTSEEHAALELSVTWLLGLQNRDGGWPTFCRGWGTLPFDRSSSDLTAHTVRALRHWRAVHRGSAAKLKDSVDRAMNRGFQFLLSQQRSDGTWLPLWFGHQDHPTDENPLYGTAKVLMAFTDAGSTLTSQQQAAMKRAVTWLVTQQNTDGGWSAAQGLASSSEETGLALEALAQPEVFQSPGVSSACDRGAEWLIVQIQTNKISQPTPIGFYFAKLWYFERLYPLIFAAAGLLRWNDLKEKREKTD